MRIQAKLLPGAKPRIAVEFIGGFRDPEAAGMLAATVVGGRWRNSIKRWMYPATVDKIREMRRAWGADLKVHRDLGSWYRQAARAQRNQAKVGAQPNAVLHVVPHASPALYADLAPDQRAGARWIANAYDDAGLYAPEMGVGKTRTVIAGLMERRISGRVIIVCPKISVRSVWGRELAKYTDWPVFLARGTRAQRERAIDQFWMTDAFLGPIGQPRVLVVVAEMLRIKAKLKNGRIQPDDKGKSTFVGFEYPELFGKKRPWDAIVLDESQKLLASLTTVKATLAGFGLKKLPQSTTPSRLRLAVTATPYGDGGEVYGMFGTFHWLWPKEYTSLWNFAEENFILSEQKIGKDKSVKKMGPLRIEGGVEAFYKTLGPRVFRRTLEEVSPDHKGKLRYWVQDCEMEPAQEKQYRYLSDHGEVMTVGGGLLIANGPLAELTRARQVANGEVVVTPTGVVFSGVSGKLEALMAALEERGITTGRGRRKVVIASQFNEFLWVVCDRLDDAKVPYHLMTGATSDTKRDAMMDAFQARGGPRVFVLNGKAGGVSITLDAADEMHQLDEMYPPEANEQLHRRIFRRSRVHKAHIIYYRSMGTIDENIAGSVGAKLHQQLKAMDGRRGRSVVRELVKYQEA